MDEITSAICDSCLSSDSANCDILAENYDVTIQSKNTGHIWYIHNPEYPGEGEYIIFHKHRASQPYHQHGRARNLRQAVRSIMGQDVFQIIGGNVNKSL